MTYAECGLIVDNCLIFFRRGAFAACVTVTALTSGIVSAERAHAQSSVSSAAAYCKIHPNDRGPGEQPQPPKDVRAAGADFWRCLNGKTLVCYGGASGESCVAAAPMDASRLAAFREFCRDYPGNEYIPRSLSFGLSSEWKCVGRTPTRVRTLQVDTQGFFVGSWRALPDQAGGSGTQASMRPAATPIRLTSIPYELGGSNCSLYTRLRNGQLDYDSFVGGIEYGDKEWDLGVNGKRYRLPEVEHDPTRITLRGPKAAPTVVITKQGIMKVPNQGGPSLNLDRVSVALTLSGNTEVASAYLLCGEG